MKSFAILVLCFLNLHYLYAQSNVDSIEHMISDLRNNVAPYNPAKAVEGLLKAKEKATDIQYTKGIMKSSYTLMLLYYNEGNYGKVIEESVDTEKAAQKLADNEYLSDVYRMRGISYDEMSLGESALKEIEKAYVIAGKIATKHILHYKKALIYEAYAGIYNKKEDFGKEISYRYRSIAEASSMTENNTNVTNAKYHNLALQFSSLALAFKGLGKKDSAVKYFEKAQKIYENNDYNIYINGKATLLSDMAIFYYENEEYRKAVQLAKKAELYEKQTSMPYVRREIYKTLFNSYPEIKELDSSKYYLRLYTAINDSLIEAEKKSIYKPVNQIISDKEAEKNKTVKNVFLFSAIILLVMLIPGWFFWRNKHRKLYRDYEKLIEKLKQQDNSFSETEGTITEKLKESSIGMPANKEKGLQISDNTLSLVLNKLEEFEKSDFYLKKNISLNYLSNFSGVNHRYVSETIKVHKGKTFSAYINDLRIDFITKLLYEEPKYRRYKISYLADICGFSSREVFASAFKKRTGISPSFFIENLKGDV